MKTPAAKPAPAVIRPASRWASQPFLGLIDAVIVDGPADFAFSGAVPSDVAHAVWMWMVRSVAPDLIDLDVVNDQSQSLKALDLLMPELLVRARKLLAEAQTSAELAHRLRTQLGSEVAAERLPLVLHALACRGLLEKAKAFGRAANGMPDEASLALALQSMPLSDQPVAALLFQAAVGQVASPTRLVTAAIRIAGGPTEQALARAGFTPLLEAIVAHAQDQIPTLMQVGTFGDMDLICRAVDRFHRLMRAVTGYVEFSRGSRWPAVAAALTKAVSDRLEPKLRDVGPDVNKALRKRDGVDRLDGDMVLSALNGMYLVATVRDCRDSLAVNAVYDQVWSQVGQALEIHVERLLQQVRNNPGEPVAAARFDAALKMAAIRFGQDFAETLRRASDLERRA